MGDTIKKLSIEGFKSIGKLEDFELRSLNVLIGANGAGKSNFVSFFRLLREIIDQRLQLAVNTGGGADAFLYMGPKVTGQIAAKLQFGESGYDFTLLPTVDNRLVFADETVTWYKTPDFPVYTEFGSGHSEAVIRDAEGDPAPMGVYQGPPFVCNAVASWVVFHFHDTGDTAAVRRWGAIIDNEFLRPDARNLAAFLYRLRTTHPEAYKKIRDVVRLAVPFFDDFKLRAVPQSPEMIQLEWTQTGSEYFFRPSQLSDGTLRFICLATALLQPALPSTVLFDEPELGLHPYALTLLANLLQQAARRSATDTPRQVIVSTQSAALLNEFAPEDVIVVERSGGQSTFRRLASDQLSEWLQEYALGELWQKNVLGGRPRSDSNGDGTGSASAPSSAPSPPENATLGDDAP